MPITVAWYKNKKQHIHYEIIEEWSWDEFFTTVEEVFALLDDIDYSVNLIIDLRATSYTPRISADKLKSVAHVTTHAHPNIDYFLMIGANAHIHALFRVFKAVFPKAGERYLIFKRLNELDDYLQSEEVRGE